MNIEVKDIKSALDQSSSENSGMLQALSEEIDETKGLISELQAFTQRKATQNTLFVFATSVGVVAAIFVARFIS